MEVIVEVEPFSFSLRPLLLLHSAVKDLFCIVEIVEMRLLRWIETQWDHSLMVCYEYRKKRKV